MCHVSIGAPKKNLQRSVVDEAKQGRQPRVRVDTNAKYLFPDALHCSATGKASTAGSVRVKLR